MTVLRVLGGGATQGWVEARRAAFERATGWTIDGSFGAVGAMKARLLAGEPADLMILSRTLIEELARAGHVAPASMADIARVATAVAVRERDPAPDIATPAALRGALLGADAIHFPDPAQATAGIHFDQVLRQLGIRDAVAGRLRVAPNGATAMRALADSQARQPIGCTQETEIRATSGIVLVGPLPPGCDLTTVYSAAITARAAAPGEAAALLAL